MLSFVCLFVFSFVCFIFFEHKLKGTPHYLAPEILLGLPHTQAVDWWALGVLLFECLHGYPPFDGDSVQAVFQEIFAGTINWPKADECEMTSWCKDLITKLLETDPEKRLHEAVKVKAHPFFLHDDPDFWLTLNSFDPPYIPEQASAEDTSAFDERKEYFPILDEGEKLIGQEDDGKNDSSDDDSDSSDYDTPDMPRKDVQNNFWHVSVHNLGLLNSKK